MDKLRPLHSNELESLLECIRMIGGSKEYQQALVLAAYARLFKKELVITFTEAEHGYFCVSMRKASNFLDGSLNWKLPSKYKWMFEEEENGD